MKASPLPGAGEMAVAALQAGKSLDEVADECGVKPLIVLDYLYRCYKEEGTLPDNLNLRKAQVSCETRDKVFALFASMGRMPWGLFIGR